MVATTKQILSSDVKKIIHDALVNLGEVRTGVTWQVSRGIQEAEGFFNNGFTDESYKDERILYHDKIARKKTNRFVVTTCEALECFFIPCIDVENIKLATYLSNINGLADCLLNDIKYLIDNVLIKNNICFMGDPYALSPRLKNLRGSSSGAGEEIIENTDAGSFILSTILMAKYFIPDLIQFSFDKSNHDSKKITADLDKIITKGVGKLLSLHAAVNGKGWPLAVNSKEPSIFATWSTLEFIADLFTYRDKLKLNNIIEQTIWNNIEEAKTSTLKWLEKECIPKTKKKILISSNDFEAYTKLNKEVREVEKQYAETRTFDEKDYIKRRSAIIEKYGRNTIKIEENFLPLYDKVQVAFSLLLCECKNSDLIENRISEVLEYYFDRSPDGIWENFINLYYPPNKEYKLTENLALYDYGIVFEVMRLLLMYADTGQQPNISFSDKLTRHGLQDKLNTIYNDDSINDRNIILGGKYESLWSKFQFELNYTENAIEALSSYATLLEQIEILEGKEKVSRGTINVSLDIKELVQILIQDTDFANLLNKQSDTQKEQPKESTEDELKEIRAFYRKLKLFTKDMQQADFDNLKRILPHTDSIIEAAKYVDTGKSDINPTKK
ncbi:MAG: hypothetical protein WC405_08235 [Syntrophales bacterium]